MSCCVVLCLLTTSPHSSVAVEQTPTRNPLGNAEIDSKVTVRRMVCWDLGNGLFSKDDAQSTTNVNKKCGGESKKILVLLSLDGKEIALLGLIQIRKPLHIPPIHTICRAMCHAMCARPRNMYF